MPSLSKGECGIAVAVVDGVRIDCDGAHVALSRLLRLETELNALGYRLVHEDNLAAATAVFKLDVEAYPSSPNGYDSLGEAYLRSGNYDKATEMYQRALDLLETADVSGQLRQQMENNGKAKLSYLSAPSEFKAATEDVDFLANNERYPYGRLHPDAPPETAHWGRLAGEWDCTLDAYVNPDVSGTNLRMYLPAEKRWEAVWFTNGANTTSRFDAISNEEEIVMTGANAQGNAVRITFFDITEDTFEWKSENSRDGGETWQETSRIHGRRVQ